MGPKGMRELGETILQRTGYCIKRLKEIEGVAIRFDSFHFKEFVVDFSKTGKRVSEINGFLRGEKIFGGKDLTQEFAELKDCALYCVTETHSKEDIDKLVDAVERALS